MRFQDPSIYVCPICGHEGAASVDQLLALTAVCGKCKGSLQDLGKHMRKLSDDVCAFSDAIAVLMRLEDNTGLSITDEVVERIRPWKDARQMTLEDLVSATALVANNQSGFDPRLAVELAATAEFPNAPRPFDFTQPLLDVLSPYRWESAQ